MLAEHLYGACLRSLVAHLLEKRDARAGRNLSGATIEQAVLVKIDLATVLRLQKAETADVVEAFHGPNRVIESQMPGRLLDREQLGRRMIRASLAEVFRCF